MRIPDMPASVRTSFWIPACAGMTVCMKAATLLVFGHEVP
jgi:hypothetical protein